MPREAEVAIFLARRGRTEILAVRRCAELGGYWHTIAGGIEPGESPDEAARRELEEETGLRVDGVGAPFVNRYPIDQEPPESRARFAPGLTEVPVHAYLVDVGDDWEPHLDWEHDDHRWRPVDEVATAYRWPETGEALRALLAAP
jgi:8-oxo-dGTP pyrophosphatase MutT (NUDIX family)